MASAKKAKKNRLLVAAIDFGTTFTGWAYQFQHDYDISPTKVYSKNWNNGTNISFKAPTTVLIRPDGRTFDSFGYDAEDKFAELTSKDEQDSWFYFSQFKMKLFNTKAGIDGDRLMIALEPEAASVYCKELSLDPHYEMKRLAVDTFSPGQKYLVLDAGGGTIDMSVHEVLSDGNLKELHKPTGSNFGGTTVDKAFEEFLCQLFGRPVMNKFKDQHLDDYLGFLRVFEVKKRGVSITKETNTIFCLPPLLVDMYETETGSDVGQAISQSNFARNISFGKGNKMKIESSVMTSFFKEAIDVIISQVETVLKDQRVAGCNAILMVGGYSESDIMREAIREKFPYMDVVTPSEASLAVLKGAVLYGRNPHVITSRVCKYTYGVDVTVPYDPSVHSESKKFVDVDGVVRADDVFLKIVEVGQDVTPEHSYRGQYLRKPEGGDPAGYTPLYASTQTDPSFTDDEGCFKVGDIPYDHKDQHGNISRILYILQFGGTEIKVTNLYETTGEERKTTLRLPD